MSAQHTPGPLTVLVTKHPDPLIIDKTGCVIAQVSGGLRGEANANLFAAAPELLAALQAAINDIELLTPLASPQLTDKGIAEVNSHVVLYRAAIAKAKP